MQAKAPVITPVADGGSRGQRERFWEAPKMRPPRSESSEAEEPERTAGSQNALDTPHDYKQPA